jgi:tellurite resistance protein TerC
MNEITTLWIIFGVVVGVALAVDLGMKSHRHRVAAVTLKEAARWTCLWVSLAFAFCGVVYYFLGPQRAMEFLTAYLVEESLSVDNMFVFVLIFKFFSIPPVHQPRILKWGILGAVIMRFILIFAGVALLQRFHWILYVFGAILIITAIKMLFQSEENVHPDQNWVLRMTKRFIPVTNSLHGEHFFVQENGKKVATPLFTTLLVIEASDLMFAMDSIPAVLAISSHPFIVFSSNVFAILGLRALFFLVSGIMDMFRFLRYGLSIILVFIGSKMLLSDFFHVPVGYSLGVVALCLIISIVASVTIKPKEHA